MPDPMADPVPSAAPSRPSSVWLVDLDDLGRDIATFRSTQHETVLRLPRADWEAQGRPGTVRVEVSG